MKIGQVVRVKIREERKNGAHDVYAEGIVNGIVPEYGHTTYIISNAKIIGDFKTRTPLPVKKVSK